MKINDLVGDRDHQSLHKHLKDISKSGFRTKYF